MQETMPCNCVANYRLKGNLSLMLAYFRYTQFSAKTSLVGYMYIFDNIKGVEYVPNIFMSFDKYLFLEVTNILI